MKISCLRSLAVVGMTYSLAACYGPEKVKKESIDFVVAMSNPSVELKASDYFSKIRYLPLETSDSSLVGENPIVQLFGDKIIVTTSQKQCLLFDKATGRFISSVGHVGNDPEGYSSVNCWSNDKKDGSIYFKGWQKELVCYNSDGTFKGKIKIPSDLKEDGFALYDYLNEDTYVGYYSGLFTDGKEQLFFFRDNQEISRKVFAESGATGINAETIESFSILKGEPGVSHYGPAAREGVIILGFKDPETGYISFTGNNRFWHIGEDLYFKNMYNDTIYQVVDTTLIPSFTFDLGKYHWDYSDRFKKERGKEAILITQILDSEDFMLFRFTTGLFGKATIYNGLFTKATGDIKICEYNDALKDDLTNFLPIQPSAVSPDGEFTDLISAEKVVTWFEDNADMKETLPKELRDLKQVKVDDNPVVVLLE